MARIAGCHGMRAKQGESILMPLNRLNAGPPPLNAMAVLAVRSELPAMKIGVAILASHSYILEYRL
jgi:hypothetical protein